MILYLTTQARTDLLNFYSEREEALPVKKMTGSFILKQFVIYDMRNFSHCTELVVDREACRDDDETFVEAIEDFATMYQARVTVIAEALNQKDMLFLKLLEAGVGNIVTAQEIDGQQKEIERSLSRQGLKKYRIQERLEIYREGERYAFVASRIQIAVIGAQGRIGVTTTALGFANWLQAVGGRACYVEANSSGHMTALTADYEMEPEDHGFALDGVGYYKQQPEREYSFVITDYGEVGKSDMKIEADLLLLVCGVKPFELSQTLPLLERYEEQKAIVLFPFVEQNMRADYKEAFSTECHRVLFLEYQPDCLDGWPNGNVYKTVVKPYIAGE